LIGNGYANSFNVSNLFGDSSLITSVWKWVASSSTWAFYSPSFSDGGASYSSAQGYQALTTINGGDGFWVNAANTLSVSMPGGSRVLSSTFSTNGANALNHGWSLISIGDGGTPLAFNNSLSSTPPVAGVIANNLTSLWAWDSVNSAWLFYSPILDGSGNLQSYISTQGYEDFITTNYLLGPSTGFWVNMH